MHSLCTTEEVFCVRMNPFYRMAIKSANNNTIKVVSILLIAEGSFKPHVHVGFLQYTKVNGNQWVPEGQEINILL